MRKALLLLFTMLSISVFATGFEKLTPPKFVGDYMQIFAYSSSYLGENAMTEDILFLADDQYDSDDIGLVETILDWYYDISDWVFILVIFALFLVIYIYRFIRKKIRRKRNKKRSDDDDDDDDDDIFDLFDDDDD